MKPAHLLPLLALAACAATPPLVTTAGVLPAPTYAVAGDTLAADEVRRQLTARGAYAETASTIIRVGFASAPRKVGTCAKPDPAATNACAQWLDAPQSGFAPFAPERRYRLTLALDSGAIDSGSVTVVQPGSAEARPLPAMVSAALAALASASATKG